MEFILGIMLIVGISCVIISLLLPKEKIKEEEIEITKVHEELLEKKEDNLIKTINEADDAIEQLNDISKQIFLQQEEKYQELLYLYEIIEQKKKELTDISEASLKNKENMAVKLDKEIEEQDILELKENIIEKKSEKKSDKNINEIISKYDEIFELSRQGLSIVEIARKLNMGQGEVGLILDFKKRGEKVNNE